MTRDQIRAILESWRPGMPEPEAGRVAEAMRLAEADTELASWLAQWKQQQAFDAAVAARLQAVPVPWGLRAAVLAQAKPVRKPFWQVDLLPYLRRAPERWAAVAAAVVLLSGAVWLSLRQPPSFAEYREEIVQIGWAANPHLAFQSSSLSQIRQWLAQRGVRFGFELPSALHDLKVRGCNLLEWRGHRVVMLCLTDGRGPYHLFVAENVGLPDSPWSDRPDYQDAAGWKTIAWSVGERTYLLTGMKYSTFTRRVYQGGVWRMSS